MPATVTQELQNALKEWSVAVDALVQGETIVLLRKGGIRETTGHFSVKHSLVWLYPTYEHQNPVLLKPAYAQQVSPVAPSGHPDSLIIQAWAEITHIFSVSEANQVNALLPYHIWTDQFATERFRWKPKQPLFVLLLRVHRLDQALTIPYQSAYGGCRSWIQLAHPMATTPSRPVLNAADYQARVQTLETLVNSTLGYN